MGSIFDFQLSSDDLDKLLLQVDVECASLPTSCNLSSSSSSSVSSSSSSQLCSADIDNYLTHASPSTTAAESNIFLNEATSLLSQLVPSSSTASRGHYRTYALIEKLAAVNKAIETDSISRASDLTHIPHSNIEFWLTQEHLLPSSHRHLGAGAKPSLSSEDEMKIFGEIKQQRQKGNAVKTADVLSIAHHISGKKLGMGWFYGFAKRMGGIRLVHPKVRKSSQSSTDAIVRTVKLFWSDLDEWRRRFGILHVVSIDEVRNLFERYSGKVVKLPDEAYAWVNSEGKTMAMASIVLSISDTGSQRFPPLFVFAGEGKQKHMHQFTYSKYDYQVEYTPSSWLNHLTYHSYLSKSILPRLPHSCGLIHDANKIHLHPMIDSLLSENKIQSKVTPESTTRYNQANDTESVNEKFKLGFESTMRQLIQNYRKENPLSSISAQQWRDWYVQAGCTSYYEYLKDDDIRKAFIVTGVWMPNDGSATDRVQVCVNNVHVARPPFVSSSVAPSSTSSLSSSSSVSSVASTSSLRDSVQVQTSSRESASSAASSSSSSSSSSVASASSRKRKPSSKSKSRSRSPPSHKTRTSKCIFAPSSTVGSRTVFSSNCSIF
eukprot:TRINITY_DN3716_c0_g1_i5.p1 TRINITY_DN3716_c0_g1~~TRINITY_DN3716_c0_g1_i5.p1  ORF type:complete len:611 (-),score=137.38 TRINITY_DN3716_c0_g1_i5:1275-3086(-)